MFFAMAIILNGW